MFTAMKNNVCTTHDSVILTEDRLQHALAHCIKHKPERSVYVLLCESFIKVGIAWDVDKRVRQLQTAVPFRIVLLRSWTAKNALHQEQELHLLLSRFHHSGEWFKLTAESIQIVKDFQQGIS